MWHADLVGKVKGYPRTEESYRLRQETSSRLIARINASGKPRATRAGIPDGWAGRRDEVIAIRDRAKSDAEKIVKHMIDNDMVEIPKDDAGRIEAALTCLVTTVMDGTQTTRERTSASKTVLDFLKAKPAQKSEVALTSPEAFLALLAQKDKPQE